MKFKRTTLVEKKINFKKLLMNLTKSDMKSVTARSELEQDIIQDGHGYFMKSKDPDLEDYYILDYPDGYQRKEAIAALKKIGIHDGYYDLQNEIINDVDYRTCWRIVVYP